jgi:hypothetical protein
MLSASSPLRIVVALVILVCTPELRAATPRDELLRLVPPDTAVCFIVTGLRDQAKAVGESPFAAWVAEKVGPKIAGTPELATLKQLDQMVEAQIGISLAEFRDDILGDAIVLAYQPGPPGKPNAEHGAVLVKARDAKKLLGVIERLNTAQKEKGEIAGIQQLNYKGFEYFRRVKPEGAGEFYHVRDGLFVFSAQEAAIKEVIEQASDAQPKPSVADSIKRIGVPEAFLTCWVNPRRLDGELKAQAEAAKDPGRRAFLEQLGRVWAGVDGLAIYFDVRKDAELGIAVSITPDRLPGEVRPLLASAPKSSAVWQLIPPNAMIAAGGRVDIPALLTAVSSFAPVDDRPALHSAVENKIGPLIGRSNLKAALAGVGPDVGIWVAPPVAGGKTWVPTWTAAVRVRDPADWSALKVLGFWVQAFQLDYNQKHDDQLEVRTDPQPGNGLTTVSNEKVFPPGFRPTFGLKEGFLVVAGSPDAWNRFTSPSPAEEPAGESLVLRVSAAAIRQYLQEHGESFGKWFAHLREKPEGEVVGDLRKLTDVLEPVDRVEVLLRGDEKRFGLAVRVKLVKPLAK